MFPIEKLLEAFSSSADVPQGAKDAMLAAATEIRDLRESQQRDQQRVEMAEKAINHREDELHNLLQDLRQLYQAAGVNSDLTPEYGRYDKALQNIRDLKHSDEKRAEALATLQERATGCRSDAGLFGSDGWIDRVIRSIETNATLRSPQARACEAIAKIIYGHTISFAGDLPDKVAELKQKATDRERGEHLDGRADRAEARVKDLESQVRDAEDKLKEVYDWVDQHAPRVTDDDHSPVIRLASRTITEQLNIVADARSAKALEKIAYKLWTVEVQLGLWLGGDHLWLGDDHQSIVDRIVRINQRLGDMKQAMCDLWRNPASQES